MNELLDSIPTSKFVYGWKRPFPGRGAFDLLPHADTSGITVLDEVDPRSWMWPALNQLKLGACTANATNRAMRVDAHMDEYECGELSRLWTYYFERAIEHTLGQGDVGAQGHDAYTVAKHGIPREVYWPYDISQFEVKPPNKPRAYTLKKPIHAVPDDVDAHKAVLSNRQVISFGFTVFESFEDQSWWSEGEMPMPEEGEGVMGGHEVLECGFLKSHPGFTLCLNSWDTTFGIDGYFLMPNSYRFSSYCSDSRTIVRPAGK